jgi:hypothetical protein
MGSFAHPFAFPFGSGFSFVPGPGGSSLSALDPTPPGSLSSQIDQLIDPVTFDYVRTPDGEWAETADSRSTVLIMIELELGASPFDPGDGTTLAELRRTGAPVTPETIKEETLRVGDILQAAGIISGLVVEVRDQSNKVVRDAAGRTLASCSWHDLASGSPVDLVFQG